MQGFFLLCSNFNREKILKKQCNGKVEKIGKQATYF